MIRKTAKLGLAAFVLLAGITGGVAAADSQAAQQVTPDDGATQVDVVTANNDCPFRLQGGVSPLCGGGGGDIPISPDPCNDPLIPC
ncbi:hypothetical protein [Halorussus halobius]|uniref:hypothetical protein n=1 Tax=Halorussus halobius TaxID=1710537 RepID=UPI0010926756|nr:hypothetical protein [Halorussus halobius]